MYLRKICVHQAHRGSLCLFAEEIVRVSEVSCDLRLREDQLSHSDKGYLLKSSDVRYGQQVCPDR
jgi:hypothetical protein